MRLALPVWAMLGTWLGADALVLPRDDSALAEPSIPPVAGLGSKILRPKGRGFTHSGPKTPPKQPPKEDRMIKKSELDAREPVGGALPMYSTTTAKKWREIFSGEESAKRESDAPRDLNARGPVGGAGPMYYSPITAKKLKELFSDEKPAKKESDAPRDLSARAPVAGGFSTWWPTTTRKERGKTSSGNESAKKGWDLWDAPPRDPAPDNKAIAARDEEVSGRPPVAKPPSKASRFTRTGRITEIKMGTSYTVGKEPVESTGPKPPGTEDKDRNLAARGTGEDEPLESTLAARDTSSEPSAAEPIHPTAQRPRRPGPGGDDGDETKHDETTARNTTAEPAAPDHGHERVATNSESGRGEQRAGRAEILDCDKRLGLAGQSARIYTGTVGGDSRKGTSRISSPCTRTRFRPALSEDLEPPAAP